MNKYGFFFFLIKTQQEVCKIASEQRTQRLWKDKTEVEMLGHNAKHHIWRKSNTTYQYKHLPTVKLQSLGTHNVGHRTLTSLSHQ